MNQHHIGRREAIKGAIQLLLAARASSQDADSRPVAEMQIRHVQRRSNSVRVSTLVRLVPAENRSMELDYVETVDGSLYPLRTTQKRTVVSKPVSVLAQRTVLVDGQPSESELVALLSDDLDYALKLAGISEDDRRKAIVPSRTGPGIQPRVVR